MASRYELTAEQRHKIEHLLPGKASDRGRTGMDNRLFVNGSLWGYTKILGNDECIEEKPV